MKHLGMVSAACLATVVAATPAARAGRWIHDIGCATLGSSPPRVAMRVFLWERHWYLPDLCTLTIRPMEPPYPGYQSLPILGCMVPSRFTCGIDSGIVTITPTPGGCLDNWTTSDSLALIVDGMKPCFVGEIQTSDGTRDVVWICFDCEASGAPPVGVGERPDPGDSSFVELRSENPWRTGSARIVFRLTRTERVLLRIHDLAGQAVRTVADRVFEGGREHAVTWDGRNDSGRKVPRGVYFYRLRTPSFTGGRKLVVMGS